MPARKDLIDYQPLLGLVTRSGRLPPVSDLWRNTRAFHEIIGYRVYRYRGRLQR